tara:strand:- start:31 stop:507 length:477 start_codon:yes stop_codon:yes gene_type:complete
MNNYRPCVGIMLINSQHKVLIGKRLDSKVNETFAWQMPQGGIDEGEDSEIAAFRELNEEIGTNNASIICEYKKWLKYDLPGELRKTLWQGKYIGQSQKWFAMKFLGEDSEININTQNPEFIAWKWVKPEDLLSVVVPFKLEIYNELVQKLFPEALKNF